MTRVMNCVVVEMVPFLVFLQGKMELEFEIVTEEEEQLRPAGRAREEPNINPHLDDPQ